MIEKLLPCPLCGRQVKVHNDGHEYGSIECSSCSYFFASYGNEGEDDKKENIKKWNTRHAPEGYVLVPVEPTKEMLKVDVSPMLETGNADPDFKPHLPLKLPDEEETARMAGIRLVQEWRCALWKAMIAAAQKAVSK